MGTNVSKYTTGVKGIMSKLVKDGHPALTSYAKHVALDENVLNLIKAMQAIMLKGDYRGAGTGLAANQVGVLKRIIVIDISGFNETIINPEITRRFGGLVGREEGCLSFPGIRVMKVRHRQIVVEGFDEARNEVRHKLKGWAARVVQHEVDHLNGITIKMSDGDGNGKPKNK